MVGSLLASAAAAQTKFDLDRAEKRAHILEGYLKALDHLDEVIALIRAAADRDSARAELVERYALSVIQAQAILDLRLSQLTALESDQIKQEHADLVERIRELDLDPGDSGEPRELLLEIVDRARELIVAGHDG